MKKALEPAQLLPTFNKGLTKTEIRSLVAQSIETITERGNVLEIAELLGVMEEFIAQFRKDGTFVGCVRNELEKYSGKFQTANGTKIEILEAGVKYDYSANGTWNDLVQKIDVLTNEKKAIEEKLRKIPAGKTSVDEETGELLEGPPKSSTSTYKVVLVKK